MSAICLLANASLIPEGLALHDSDQCAYLLTAEHFYRFGEWRAFPLTIPYGGTALTVLRALWTWLYAGASQRPDAFITGQMVFSYWISPLMITFLSYFMVRAYCSRGAALLAGVVAAVGFHFFGASLSGWIITPRS